MAGQGTDKLLLQVQPVRVEKRKDNAEPKLYKLRKTAADMHKTRHSVEPDAMIRLLPSRQEVAHVLRREDVKVVEVTVFRDGPVLHTPRDSGVTAGLEPSPQQRIVPCKIRLTRLRWVNQVPPRVNHQRGGRGTTRLRRPHRCC